MPVLMDTHVVLWMAYQPSHLSETARQILLEEQHLVYSIVSLWEIGLKLSRGTCDLKIPGKWHQDLPDGFARQGIDCLEITPAHCRTIQDLPNHHKDPFDRMLIAQAKIEGLILLTKDKRFRDYDVEVIW